MSSNQNAVICWICGKRPADSGEHRLKASDIRSRATLISQRQPIFLQTDGVASNIPVASAKSRHLKFADSVCRTCNNAGTSQYDEAWRILSNYLTDAWPEIRCAGEFDSSLPFRGDVSTMMLRVHLYFVKVFGCKLFEERISMDLGSFSAALIAGTAHAEIGINFVDSPFDDGEAVAFESYIYTMSNERGEIDGLTWLYLVHPIGVKVSYIKQGARLYVPGFRWSPDCDRTTIPLSPFEGATEPIDGPAALR